jgi:tRNA (guanine37-N1)-methyltransferase
VKPFGEDGRDFIKAAAHRAWGDPFPEFVPKISKSQAKKAKKAPVSGESHDTALTSASESVPVPQPNLRRQISHFVMNLPDSAIEFLDAFRGILAEPELRDAYEGRMPMVHCHCFTREAEDQARAETDIRQVRTASITGRCRTLRRLMMNSTASGGETGARTDRRRDVPPCSVGRPRQGHVLYKF